ncbi:MAG: diguanylate cyclase [Burkholderiales bacterium]|nr:diguanylate cyclase [Burkholderiales bacterium]
MRPRDRYRGPGGDEFVIILTDLPQPDDTDQIAQKLLTALARPIEVAGRDVFVTASIGASFSPRDGDHGEVLLRYAETAMYRVKERRAQQRTPVRAGDGLRRHQPTGHGSRHAARPGAGRVFAALLAQDRSLSHRIIGAEALIRWQHPRSAWYTHRVHPPPKRPA